MLVDLLGADSRREFVGALLAREALHVDAHEDT